ncbi:MAG: hypothetical protein CMO34_02115 [Verrucomicrobia bacterium]|nr:hypothetical protein [Verrucomicrobiota bacterium]|tara:strand:- start:813 stop:1211 length:399 start_codon:yes stop_codon:yes gene_type:complete
MKALTIIILFLLSSFTLLSQETINLESKQLLEDENVQVLKLSSNRHSSSFLIVVEDSVRKHYHATHTENLYVLEGSGKMLLNDDLIDIQKGDFITLQPKTVHAVWVNGNVPLKALSIQAPEFKGSDRVFIDD